MALAFPDRLRPFTESWRPANASRTGGPSVSGSQQFVANPWWRWAARVGFHCVADDDYLEARGFLAGLDGQAGEFLVGPYDWRGRPWNIDNLTGAKITPDQAARSAAVDPAYEANPDTTGVLDYRLAVPAGANATTLSIQRNKGGFLKRGQYLSLGERLHIITGLTTIDPAQANGEAAAGTVGVTIRPWTRATYADGTVCEFARPVCLMRLASEDAGQIEMTTSPLSDVTLDLVEAF